MTKELEEAAYHLFKKGDFDSDKISEELLNYCKSDVNTQLSAHEREVPEAVSFVHVDNPFDLSNVQLSGQPPEWATQWTAETCEPNTVGVDNDPRSIVSGLLNIIVNCSDLEYENKEDLAEAIDYILGTLELKDEEELPALQPNVFPNWPLPVVSYGGTAFPTLYPTVSDNIGLPVSVNDRTVPATNLYGGC